MYVFACCPSVVALNQLVFFSFLFPLLGTLNNYGVLKDLIVVLRGKVSFPLKLGFRSFECVRQFL